MSLCLCLSVCVCACLRVRVGTVAPFILLLSCVALSPVASPLYHSSLRAPLLLHPQAHTLTWLHYGAAGLRHCFARPMSFASGLLPLFCSMVARGEVPGFRFGNTVWSRGWRPGRLGGSGRAWIVPLHLFLCLRVWVHVLRVVSNT